MQIPFYFFAWVASITFGLEAIIGKLTSKHSISNPWLFNFFWSLLVLIFMIPFAISNGAGIPTHWTNIFLGSIFYALAGILYVLLIYSLDISVLSPLFNFRTVFGVLLGALFLNEILTTTQYVLIGIIFISGMFLTLDEKFSLKSFFRWSIALAMIEMIVLALMSVFIKKAVADTGYWGATLWIAGLAQVLFLGTILFFKDDLKKMHLKQIGALVLMSVAGTVGALSANRAYSENVSISTAITSIPFSMIMAFLFSVFAPRLLEKHTIKIYMVRFVAATIMLIAALKL